MPGRYAWADLRACLCLAKIAFGLYALAIPACRDGIPSVSRLMTYIISKQTKDPSDLLIIYLWCGIVCFNPPADRHCWLGREPQPNCCQWVSCAWLVLVCHRRQMRLESLDAALHHRCSLPLLQQPAICHYNGNLYIPINILCDVH